MSEGSEGLLGCITFPHCPVAAPEVDPLGSRLEPDSGKIKLEGLVHAVPLYAWAAVGVDVLPIGIDEHAVALQTSPAVPP